MLSFAGERCVVLWVFCSRVGRGHHRGGSQRNRLHGAIDIWSVLPISDASSFQSMVCKNHLQLLNGALVGLSSDFLLFRHEMMFFKWSQHVLLFPPLCSSSCSHCLQ